MESKLDQELTEEFPWYPLLMYRMKHPIWPPYKRRPRKFEDHPWGREDVTPRRGRSYTRATWPPRGRGRGESLTSERRVEAMLRVPQIIEMRKQGMLWKDIALHFGYKSKSGPFQLVQRYRAKHDLEIMPIGLMT